MTEISKKPSTALRPTLSPSALSASLAGGLMLLGGGKAVAQERSTPTAVDQTVRLGPVQVGADAQEGVGPNVLNHGTSLDRLPDDLQHTPQSVTVISRVAIQQQQATTIDQILKYVPGVTVATGEGNGGMNGDAFRIRGFDAKGDVYIDGLRDFGAYVRDDFATESVQVFKGSTSESFGSGTTGGAINLLGKTAHLGDDLSLGATVGTGPQTRIVADVSRQIGDTTALRLVGMWHDQDIVDRDHIYSRRWGVLASLGLGLGTDQTLTLTYMHQDGDRRPDLGVPIILLPFGIDGYGLPVTEYGVPRSNVFGKESDRDETTVDLVTVRYHRDFGDRLSLSNDSRYARYDRRLVFTPTICGTGPGGYADFGSCSADVLAGDLDTAYTVWPVVGDIQKSTGGQNITTLTARFDTGGLRHELIAGLDIYSQRNGFGSLSGSRGRTGGTLLDPVFTNPPGFSVIDHAAFGVKARAWDVGLFAGDHVWLTETLSINAGVRWDEYHAESASWVDATAAYGPWIESETRFSSPKAALMWEPVPGRNYYISFARSFTPQGQNISFQGTVSPGQPDLSPDKADTYEIGAKWSLRDGQLGATAAAFRTTKDRGAYDDPLTGASVLVGEKDRVQGLELGLSGHVLPAWDVQASYTYLDGEILEAPPASYFSPVDATGYPVPYVSKNNVAVWSTYDLATLMRGFPGRLLAGGGINYRSGYSADPAGLYRIPRATTVDGLLSWETDRYRLALNVTNLTDELTYSSAFYFRAEVSPGRTVALTGSVRF